MGNSAIQRAQEQQSETLCLDDIEKRLLNEYQKGLPLSPTPFADMAQNLGMDEAQVLQILQRLQDQGIISRVGPVFKPHKIGASTLAAMSIPEDKLESVARQVSDYAEVNHNYEREDRYNLWFVVTASSQEKLEQVLANIEQETGYAILYLPLERQFHIDLGFPLWC
ncbi:MAG: Lrp/AsnC family transcriptional regulator [Gammaproteobacteria bacterium]|nr:Lrp/AsnC family transcriptional regulator [Gammaproteobacteria bacterium]